MKIVLLTSWISPHLLPFARELVKLVGENNFRYHYLESPPPNHVVWGWDKLGKESWCQLGMLQDSVLEKADIVISGLRLPRLFKIRATAGKKTFYMSERWFKPPIGMFRLLHPKYLKLLWQMYQCMKNDEVICLPMGIHSARDMVRVYELFNRNLRCLFKAPKVTFESKPGGNVWIEGKLFPKMKIFGYFVEHSQFELGTGSRGDNQGCKRILWVGRMLDWKHVDTIIYACRGMDNVRLSIYGNGPEEVKLKKLAQGYDNIFFHDFVHTSEVREIMREHDVYVLSSDAYEGWGAVVSEALEEGMKVLGTEEAGSSVTLLPSSNLFKSGDIGQLRKLLQREIKATGIGCWNAKYAAEALLEMSGVK